MTDSYAEPTGRSEQITVLLNGDSYAYLLSETARRKEEDSELSRNKVLNQILAEHAKRNRKAAKP